ncbi:Oxoglutarate/iron-dependent dioxygenase [uncultured Caudovirales phage]|uniref:procollagen-proline 3-dioxygenase n=1 Tax=uncultured Caudovirales phage TaxID=2100421 RepID=A0A6J7WK87_9CAUD|nr:Oxoglutarate/iron-dependent dioxygenase [uncultured Caudovirales phage]
MSKQCTCGRSSTQPYCDNTHKLGKNGIIRKIDKESFIYYKDELNDKGVLNVPENKIVEIPNFVSPKMAKNMIGFFEDNEISWGDIAFYGSSGKGIKATQEELDRWDIPTTFFEDIKNKFKEAVEAIFNREVRANTSHAQKWDVGGFASLHSDNSNNAGEPNAFEINKYVAILYLNGDYEGGQLYFAEEEKDPWLSIQPNTYSLYVFCGGVENLHGVTEITKGTRYTMVSFWDFADLVYSEETLEKWKEQERQVRIEQAAQKEEWLKGNKHA